MICRCAVSLLIINTEIYYIRYIIKFSKQICNIINSYFLLPVHQLYFHRTARRLVYIEKFTTYKFLTFVSDFISI